jgi:cytochrome c biogenesis protein
VIHWLRKLASLKITPVAMLALAVGVFVSYRSGDPAAVWVVAPLAALAVNLLCAILVTPRFRRDVGLLMFHICLLAVVALAAYGYLAQFKGRVEVAVGQQLRPDMITAVAQGPLHDRDALGRADFVQGMFSVAFTEGLFRTHTSSRVQLAAGQQREFGDTVPLELGGYRFYTSSNKGYSALVRWSGVTGAPTLGVVNFPSYPMHDWNQITRWTTPDGSPLSLELKLGEKPPVDKAWILDSRVQRQARLAIDFDGQRTVLGEGDALPVADGVLTFLETRMWMGYSVYFFPLLNWMVAFALVGVLGLGWYYLCRFGLLKTRAPVAASTTLRAAQPFDSAVP